MATTAIVYSVIARDRASRTFANVGRSMTRMSRTGATVGAALKGGLAVGGVAAAGLGATMLSTAGDFEKAMNQVRAVTNASGKDFKGLRDQAKHLGATTKFTATQAAEGMNFLAMAGFQTKDIMSAMPGVLALASAGNMDLGRSADIASNILTGYGFQAKDTGKIVDVLAKTFTSTNTDLTQLGEAFKYAGPVAHSAGIQFEEASAAIGLMGNSGIQASMAGTALRGAITRLLAPTKKVQGVLDDLGITVTDSSGKMLPLNNVIEQLEKSGANTSQMMTIFGQRAGPAMLALVDQGAGALVDLTGKLEGAGGTADRISKIQMEGLKGQMTALKSAWEGLLIELADLGALKAVTGAVEGVTGATRGLTGFVESSALPLIQKVRDKAAAMFPADTVKAGAGQVSGALDSIRDAAEARLLPALSGLWKAVSTRTGPALGSLARTVVSGLFPVLKTLAVFVAGTVLPVVVEIGRWLLTYVVPPVLAVVSAIGGPLLAVLGGLVTAGTSVVTWLRDLGTWLIPVGVLVGGLTVMLTANAVATAAVTAAFSIYRGVILAWAAVQRTAIVLQTAWNTVMALNPIGLIIIGLIALGAALVIAYKKSDTFRAIVQAAWKGIQVAALWTWEKVLKPVIGFIVKAFQWWWTAAKVYFTAVGVFFYVLGAAAVWLWEKAISPVIGWIVAGFKLWWAGAKLYFGLVGAGFRAVGAGATWLWEKAISPVINLIVGGFKLWWAGAKLYFGFVRAGFRAVGAGASWLWRKAISPAINGIKSALSVGYNVTIKPVLAALRAAIKKTGEAFDSARGAIKIAWDKVKGIAKAPVKFVVDTVYNNGLVGVWNKVASAFGAPKLSKFKFARGGPVFGAGTETSDDIPAWLSKNEHVWTAKEVDGAGGHGAVMALRKWAAAGGRGPLPGFKDGGGLFGWIGSAGSKLKGWGSDAWEKVKSGAKWLKDTLAGSVKSGVNAVVKPLLKSIPYLDTGLGKMIAKVPERMISALFGYADTADKKGASETSFGGGQIPKGQHAAIIRAALKAAGVPPPGTIGQWLSGMNTLITRESGWNANAVNNWDINAKNGVPSQGLAQTIPPTWSAYVPSSLRSKGILDPVGNVAAAIRYIVARYGTITKVQQANANAAPKGYARGGLAPIGETAWVGERGPELMQVTARGTRIFSHRDSVALAAENGLRVPGYASGTVSNAAAKVGQARRRRDDAREKLARARAARKGVTAAERELRAAETRLKAARQELANAKRRTRTAVDNALTASFRKTLTKGTASAIASAIKSMVGKLQNAGVSKKFVSSVLKQSDKLQSLATKRSNVAATIKKAEEFAASQSESLQEYLSISGSTATTPAQLIEQMKAQQDKAKDFAGLVKSLRGKGLSADILTELGEAGADSQLAKTLKGATYGDISKLNALAKSGKKLSDSYGRTLADAMFDSGKKAGDGFLTGLKAQEKELAKQMAKLADALIKSIKKKLKIKSPSQVMRDQIGKPTALGVVSGIDAALPKVALASQRMADAAAGATVRRIVIPQPQANGQATAASQQADALRRLVDAIEAGTLGADVTVEFNDDRLKDLIDVRVKPKIKASEDRQAFRAKSGRRG
ncbi:phage tail tape measure protein [Streptomyces brasiliscabiei]|uniref:Phage tail tape measure protein n=1 Tax=Streptomyces brasiliscabiei TaxID=2736302 RepID=A0ABU8G9S0_9ACTN